MNISKAHKKGKGISIIIPFRCPSEDHPRAKSFRWIVKYIEYHLPNAQIIIGDDSDTDRPFSKSVAVNHGARQATGDIFVILDADVFLHASDILHCAQEIRYARMKNQKLWFVPYRQFHRLSKETTERFLSHSAISPLELPEKLDDVDIIYGGDPNTGHWFGAGVHIVPREAFYTVGGWDPRFRGWGGEDRAAMRAFDTLYWPHKTLKGRISHLWHPMIGSSGVESWVPVTDRQWENQKSSNSNSPLSRAYAKAIGKVELMEEIMVKARRHPGAFFLELIVEINIEENRLDCQPSV